MDTPDEPRPEDVVDDWQWHAEGKFPADRDPGQAYVHIGMFVAWLARHDLVEGEALRGDGAGVALDAIRQRLVSPTGLREATRGRLTMTMLTPEGRVFTGAYYAPEYGYPRDWQRTFGRLADTYAVPNDWQTYDRIEPILDTRYAEWVEAGRPELTRLPGLLGRLARLFDRRA